MCKFLYLKPMIAISLLLVVVETLPEVELDSYPHSVAEKSMTWQGKGPTRQPWDMSGRRCHPSRHIPPFRSIRHSQPAWSLQRYRRSHRHPCPCRRCTTMWTWVHRRSVCQMASKSSMPLYSRKTLGAPKQWMRQVSIHIDDPHPSYCSGACRTQHRWNCFRRWAQYKVYHS